MIGEVLSERYLAGKHAHSAATTAGTMLLVNSIPVLPLNDADADADNVFVVEADMVRYTKPNDEEWTPGDRCYWDDSAKNITTTEGSNTLCGFVVDHAETADTEGVFALRQHLDPVSLTA